MGVTLLFLLLMSQTSEQYYMWDIAVPGYWKLQCGDKTFHWDPKEGAPACECGQTTDLYSTAVKSSGEVIEAHPAFKIDKFHTGAVFRVIANVREAHWETLCHTAKNDWGLWSF